MKTTIELPDNLLKEAKKMAARDHTTLRSLLEEGLRWVLAKRRRPLRFRLKDKGVSGKGVQPEITEGDWERIRELIYRGRGT